MTTTQKHLDQIINYIEYEITTGQIYMSSSRPREDFTLPTPGPGRAIVETDIHVDPALGYVLDGVLEERPSIPDFDKIKIYANGIDTATLTLPKPMKVTIDGVEYGPTDKIELSSEMPAKYGVLIDEFPYKTYIVEIEAV